MDVGIAPLLDKSRQALLDLSTRNRLLSLPRGNKNARLIDIVDELSAEAFRLLVQESRSMAFLAARDKKEADDASSDFGVLEQPDDDEADARGIAKRHSDLRLQTRLTSAGLQKRLLSLYYDALTFEEEQGVNILYLALGTLKWFEAEKSDTERFAPLVLVPVRLMRGNAAERFKLEWRGEEIAVNLSLQAKMKAEYGIVIPDLGEQDDFNITAYFEKVRQAVGGNPKFGVQDDEVVLGFFSFAKFLMYRDLDAENWPKEEANIAFNPLLGGLLRDGFAPAEGMLHENSHIDEHIELKHVHHVVDADSSQTLAIEEVRRGRHLVVQGPPGTGKSQTITNVIASAVAEGKTVLFVAEKMAALEVVHRRMTAIQLGPLCLELHSQKSNKRSVLEELKRTKDIDQPRAQDHGRTHATLDALKQKLNYHSVLMHQPHKPSGLTPFRVIGNSVRLKQAGIEARDIALPTALEWDEHDYAVRQELLKDLLARIKEIGAPEGHPWNGIKREALLPNEYEKIGDALIECRQALEAVSSLAKEGLAFFSLGEGTSQSIERLRLAAEAMHQAPTYDPATINAEQWKHQREAIQQLTRYGLEYKALRDKLVPLVSDIAYSTDWAMCRQNLALNTTSFVAPLKGSFRLARNLLRSVSKAPLGKNRAEWLVLVDELIRFQTLTKELDAGSATGAAVFGYLWAGKDSDWVALERVIAWRNSLDLPSLPEQFLSCASKETVIDWAQLQEELAATLPAYQSALQALMKIIGADIHRIFKPTTPEEAPLSMVEAKLIQWQQKLEKIHEWIAFRQRYDSLYSFGLEALAEKVWQSTEPARIPQLLERAYFDALAEDIFTKMPELRGFDGTEHHQLVENFKESDKLSIDQKRADIRLKHFLRIPKHSSGVGPVGALNDEFAKKRKHLALRQLIKKAGPAIQALKPVFMMSPLSVAQFLEPGVMRFDLLVMDEASQIEPVDALGAIARCDQIVVVGDSRQLPPTRFFSRMTGDVDEDEDSDEGLKTQDVESILNLCIAKGLPERMLRWHYRSRHQSLIAVSNKQFYESKLFIVPSPYDAASGMGLIFNHLPNAIYDRGATRTNPVEAKAVAQAVIHHAKTQPTRSLGVGAFSVVQRQAILDELEIQRRQHPETEPFFTAAHRDEPFFVKNLENIQGDERDVIFISVGYGKDASGYMAMNFGPISGDGGERRLNVLISRAKRRCEVFSSITADDIDLERARGAGVAALKLFLKFAQTGKLDYGQTTNRDMDSIFEEEVAAALRSRGYDVKTQIGVAGFFVDLAVTDPEFPGRFILGIECDGAAYHSSRSARDRDRLRQAVLEDHGWAIHRIWSTDWFRKPTEQLDKVIAAIESAKRSHRESNEKPVAKPTVALEFTVTSDADTITIESTVYEKSLSTPYHEAILEVPLHVELQNMIDEDMVVIIDKIVSAESPIHTDEVLLRVRNLWGLARAGSRIQAKVESAIARAVRQKLISKKGGFCYKPGQDTLVRNRSNTNSPGLRKIENISPEEIQKAVLTVIETNFGATHEQIPSEVARLLGLKQTTQAVKDTVTTGLKQLKKTSQLTEQNGLLRRA